MQSTIAGGPRALRDLALPPLCLLCDTPLVGAPTLCAACWAQMAWVMPGGCFQCGRPLPEPHADGEKCAACLADPPPYAQARAALAYDAQSAPLATRLKFSDRTDTAPALAGWMCRAGAELIRQADLITPVPLHPLRLLGRRYNQAALLAAQMAQDAGKPYAPALLHRIRPTRPQSKLEKMARQKNVHNAFAVADADAIKDKAVLLVDDVYTTGATVRECARALQRAGSGPIYVLTLLRRF